MRDVSIDMYNINRHGLEISNCSKNPPPVTFCSHNPNIQTPSVFWKISPSGKMELVGADGSWFLQALILLLSPGFHHFGVSTQRCHGKIWSNDGTGFFSGGSVSYHYKAHTLGRSDFQALRSAQLIFRGKRLQVPLGMWQIMWCFLWSVYTYIYGCLISDEFVCPIMSSHFLSRYGQF